MDGIINVLKPPGMTSHDVVQFIRKLIGKRKVGHTGTLDPGAAGVLTICCGKATKIIQFMDHTKEYRAEVSFGTATSTLDSFGQVIKEQDCSSLTLDEVREGLQKFKGEIEQIPPMTSAIKHKGKKLYELARAGLEVERKKRRVNIFFARIVNAFDIGTPNPKVIMDIGCSAGTYVRTLCSDLGENLGCCAHMSFLLRVRAGSFGILDTFTLEELEEKKHHGELGEVLVSLDQALSNLPTVRVEDELVDAVKNGNRIFFETGTEMQLQGNQLVCMQGPQGVIAIGKTLDKNTQVDTINIQPVKVLV
ncbi:MAG: tRNA pseudouridine(55) synthase TruB [Firmicutes bacterium]|nr:tRNA pseudouridine(55) synthase TruB [Bacillota bacterium]